MAGFGTKSGRIRKNIWNERLCTEFMLAQETNRAFVAPAGAQLVAPVEPDRPITLQLYYFNPGRSPATGIRRFVDFPKFKEISTGFEDWDNLNLEKNSICDLVQPSQGRESLYPAALNQTNYSLFTYEKGFSQSQLDDIKAGTLLVYINGCMRYFTVDKPRKSGFCFYLAPTKDKTVAIQGRFFSSCPTGHESD